MQYPGDRCDSAGFPPAAIGPEKTDMMEYQNIMVRTSRNTGSTFHRIHKGISFKEILIYLNHSVSVNVQ